ncbi:MAG: hypothetical protein L3J69_19695, partial [Desulfobacula sp.]|nr:hypothetical protein [Desulfobacula sp.]
MMLDQPKKMYVMQLQIILKEKIFHALYNADAFITVSKSNAELLKKAGYTGEIIIIPNGYDPEIFKPRTKKIVRRELKLPLDKKK